MQGIFSNTFGQKNCINQPSMATGTCKSAILCKYFLHGTCAKGENCTFSHSRNDPLNSVCTHWLKGSCVYGDKCRYDHVRPEWAPREDRSVPGYTAPPVPKPSADDLTAVAPISQLRLGGAAAHLVPSYSGGRSADSALEALQAQERLSPPPVDLPADPFGAGEDASTTEHDDVIASLSLDDALPDDLGCIVAGAGPLPQGLLTAQLLPEALPPPRRFSTELPPDQWPVEAQEKDSSAVVGSLGQQLYYEDRGAAEEGAVTTAEEYVGDDGSGGQSYYYEGEEGDGEGGYYGGGAAAEGGGYWTGGSYGTYSSGGDYHSLGTSPPMTAPAWHMPGGDPARFYANPALQSLCWELYATGQCTQGEGCHGAHGDWCETCGRYALHPVDAAARDAHAQECRARHDRLEAVRRSAHVECGICMERVVEKPPPADRRFGLLSCDHPFCLSCIRNWRQQYAGGADVDAALRTCPICRTPTHFITPSSTWPGTPEDRETVVAGYKAKLAEIDCRHFAYGEGNCPFGTSCMYRHAYKDGRLEEVAPRRVAANEGEIQCLQPVRLSDFIVVKQGRVRGRRR